MNLNDKPVQQKLELKKLQEQIRAFEQCNWQSVERKEEEEQVKAGDLLEIVYPSRAVKEEKCGSI